MAKTMPESQRLRLDLGIARNDVSNQLLPIQYKIRQIVEWLNRESVQENRQRQYSNNKHLSC